VNFLLGNATSEVTHWVNRKVCRSGLPCKALMHTVRIKRSTEANKIPRKRILLVEDEQLVRESIRQLLVRDEHTVVESNNGAEALALFAKGQFDLVVTDSEIPFLKGGELAAKIKQLAPRQPILMITGHQRRPSPDNPVDAVLNKPFDLNQLRKAVAGLVSEAGESLAA
jgi:CheY-like chemotaxis protein